MNDDNSENGDSGVVALVVDGITVNGSEMRSTMTYGGMACTLEEERKWGGYATTPVVAAPPTWCDGGG